MGCDIHMYVEYKVGNKWYDCDYFVPNINWKGGEDNIYDPKYRRVPIYDDRNYSLFATLANVRNYGNTEYICEPKGLPKNVTEYVEAAYDTWGFDAHSCSYLTLRELIDFHEQHHPLKHRGMLSPEQQKELDEGILPEHWCQGTNVEGYEFREWEEENNVLVPLINKLKEMADALDFIYSFSWHGNDEAKKRALEKAKDIRIVFWFDN